MTGWSWDVRIMKLFRDKECTLVKAVEILRVKHINEEVTDGQSVNVVKAQHSKPEHCNIKTPN